MFEVDFAGYYFLLQRSGNCCFLDLQLIRVFTSKSGKICYFAETKKLSNVTQPCCSAPCSTHTIFNAWRNLSRDPVCFSGAFVAKQSNKSNMT